LITKVEIRKSVIEDLESIVSLSNELGYLISPKEVLNQLGMILKDSNHFVFVAVKNQKIVGYIHASNIFVLTSLPFTEIMALVVNKNERGNGIGKLLVEKAESICINKQLRVRCNTKRELAHKFYSNLNFNLNKEQKVFEKSIK
jgi:ribosomal protein S18 acetylase RimI-like enzyme